MNIARARGIPSQIGAGHKQDLGQPGPCTGEGSQDSNLVWAIYRAGQTQPR